MAEEASTQTTLRDTIEAAVEEHVPAPEVVTTSASPSVPAQASAEPSPATPERARDAQGRFVETKEEKAERIAAKAAPAQAPVAAAPVVAAKVHPKVPSSWKKDYHDHWGKLDPSVAEYILKREGDFASGVSTYKTEYDRVKPIAEVLAQHQDSIKSLGIEPAQFVSNLANAHQALSRGTPEARLSMFMKLAQDYQVPVQQLFVRGQDGQAYFNPQVQQFQPQQQRQAPQAPDVEKLVNDRFAALEMKQTISQFAGEKDAQGNLKRPHFEKVKEDMALLLDAGKAQDLEDAYRKALRMDDELWQAEQETQRKADEAARQDQQRKAVAAARQANVSPKTATPSGAAASAKPKGLRSQLESAFDEHSASRV